MNTRFLPQCDNSVCVSIWLPVLVDAYGSGQTKVSQLQNTLFGNLEKKIY
jgi:hypothetical protein